jgi:muramoyltetrapeptide carboxypeptidase
MDRRRFIRNTIGRGVGLHLYRNAQAEETPHVIKPPALKKGDTVGLITPASPPFEMRQTMIEAQEKMENLGFRVRFGKHVGEKWGYLAGHDQGRIEDLHDFFLDDEISAIIAIRGGYGSGRLLKYLDYELIRSHPKILLGYSDITSLLLGINKMAGLVTFHGPVAVSTFTDYTRKYLFKVLTEKEPVGEIEDAPYDENLQTSNRIWTINNGTATGPLVGGNLTLLCATLGTPYAPDTAGKILFIEEVGEEPNDLDRYLTQLDNAGKLEVCAGILFDRMSDVKPADYKPGYYSNLSNEEVISDRLSRYSVPACLGFSIGHIANKPTLPLGIKAKLDAGAGKLSILESAVS